MFVRFVVGTNRSHPRVQAGVVAELRILRDSGELPGYYHEQVEELFEWMNAEVPCPPFEASPWSPDAICWFKDSAQHFISRLRDMIAILELHGRPVRMLTTTRPGVILYEDDYQIVAESKHY